MVSTPSRPGRLPCIRGGRIISTTGSTPGWPRCSPSTRRPKEAPTPTRISRRRFLSSAATAAGAVALGCRDSWIAAAPPPAPLLNAELPDPATSGIEHIVVFMMENRSFDHFLGWLPGADGRQAGLTYSDAAGVPHETLPLAPDFTGCGHAAP